MREKTIETALKRRIEAIGGIYIKMDALTYPGIPDRLIITPGGRYVFVELKAPGGRLREVQKVFIKRLKKLNCEVCIIRNMDEVNKFLENINFI